MSKSNLALNRAIAEKIMGWHWLSPDEFPDTRSLAPPGYKAAWLHAAKGDERIVQTRPSLPDYAGDANLTMQVVEEMRKTHKIYITFDVLGGDVNMIKQSGADAGTPDTCGESFAAVSELGACLCRAALRARGHSTEGL